MSENDIASSTPSGTAVPPTTDGARVTLWWLPVGAGGHVVIHTSRWWEAYHAHRERRRPRPLFHAALEVHPEPGTRYVIEMAPAWGQHTATRGVVTTGPVGLRCLGRSQLFRYEIRCWRDGTIPDQHLAPEPPTLFPLSPLVAQTLVARVADVPRHTWGRDTFGTGDMWNSNSVISWLLHTSGIETADLTPPHGGYAPGWAAGITAARATRSGTRRPRARRPNRSAHPDRLGRGASGEGSRWQ